MKVSNVLSFTIREAKAYLADPVYGSRLKEISQAFLDLEQKDPREIFGHIDAIKVYSSMTLFECADESEDSVFSKVLDKFYGGYRDQMTLAMIKGRR